MEIEQLAPILIAVVAAIPGTLAFLAQRKKDDNEMAKAVQEAAIALVKPLQSEVERLGKKVLDMEALLLQKDARIAELQTAVTDRDHRIDEMEDKISKQQKEITALQRSRKT